MPLSTYDRMVPVGDEATIHTNAAVLLAASTISVSTQSLMDMRIREAAHVAVQLYLATRLEIKSQNAIARGQETV